MRRCVTLGLLLLVTGCGGQKFGDPNLGSRSIARDAPPPIEQLVTSREVRAAPPGSARRTFLSYWRNVQFAHYDRALGLLDDRLREAVSDGRIADGLRTSIGIYRTSRPRIVEERAPSKKLVLLYFTGRTARSPAVAGPASAQLTRTANGWRISRSSALESELRASAIKSAQRAAEPNSQVYGAPAVRAGDAAVRLYRAYVAGTLKREAPGQE